MRMALDAIEEEQGRRAGDLPGGPRTVEALMRREMVEVIGEWSEARVFLPEHRHTWRTSIHLDGCHNYSTGGTCECGAQLGVRGERSFKRDPYSMVWAMPDECPRCRELMNGARPRHSVTIVARKGRG